MAGPGNSAALAKRFGGVAVDDAAPAPAEAPAFDGSVLFDPTRKPASTEDFRTPTTFENVGGALKDTAIGGAKGAFHSLMQLAELASKSQMVPGVPLSAADIAQHGEDATPYTNTAQRVGGGIETLLELVAPGMMGAKAVPTTARAGKLFEEVMGAAGKVAVDAEAPGAAALRIADLAEHGGRKPKIVNDFLKWVTDPNKSFTYEEARKFATNLGQLSVQENLSTNPALKREINEMRVVLNKAIADAAQKAGKGAEYKAAMRGYSSAKRIAQMGEDVLDAGKRAIPYATAGGLAEYLASKLKNLGG